jgi:hypothetical protein
VTAFFIPGLGDHDACAQHTYQQLRTETELQMGRAPRDRRIHALWTRRGNLDCVTTVGQPDPITGQTVIAIFDMGPHQPFLVYHHNDHPPPITTHQILGDNAYTVSEFDP